MKKLLWAAAALSVAAATPTLATAQQSADAAGMPRLYIQSGVAPVSPTLSSHRGFKRIARIDNIKVPTGASGIFVATFGGESVCGKVNDGQRAQCSIRIVCDGVPLLPDEAGDFQFNSHAFGFLPRGLSLTRRSETIRAGTHSCEVRSRVVNAFHTLDQWTFTIEFWRQG